MDWSNTSSPASRALDYITIDETAAGRPPMAWVVGGLLCMVIGLVIAGTSIAVLTLAAVTGNAAAALVPSLGLILGLLLIVLGRRLPSAACE